MLKEVASDAKRNYLGVVHTPEERAEVCAGPLASSLPRCETDKKSLLYFSESRHLIIAHENYETYYESADRYDTKNIRRDCVSHSQRVSVS